MNGHIETDTDAEWDGERETERDIEQKSPTGTDIRCEFSLVKLTPRTSSLIHLCGVESSADRSRSPIDCRIPVKTLASFLLLPGIRETRQ